MINVAILGFGVVGSGVYEVLNNSEHMARKTDKTIIVKHILDIRDFSGEPFAHLIRDDFNVILNDDDVDIVCELIGGVGVAYEFTKKALSCGKSVVTSNKELVATHGAELLEIAKEKNVYYLFEASVGGGIPIIRPLNQCLAANEITEILGILNGTTNYILSMMYRHNVDFAQALSEAQGKGYAESDPTADVEGHDTCRKLAILSSLVFGKQVPYREIPTEGITRITDADINYARAQGYVIKLIAKAQIKDNRIFARVCPMLLHHSQPLSTVSDVYNAVLVNGSATGEVMFYGRGAGKLPTASAVVADIIDIIRNGEHGTKFMWDKSCDDLVGDLGSTKSRFFMRIKQEHPAELTSFFTEADMLSCANSDEVAFTTADILESDMTNIRERFAEYIINCIRIA